MAADGRAVAPATAELIDLERLAKRLNAATDELNASLQEIQDRLNSMGLGVDVWLEESLDLSSTREMATPGDRRDPSPEFTLDFLGYGRFGDGWALLVQRRHAVRLGPVDGCVVDLVNYVEIDEATPLMRASKKIRLAAVAQLPQLIQLMKLEAQRQITAIENAKKLADLLR